MMEPLHELESAVERDMGLLRALPAIKPDPACMERLHQAVAAESERVWRRRRGPGVWRGIAGLAAAAVLVGALVVAPGGGPSIQGTQLPGGWADAWESSSERLVGLLDGGWIRADYGLEEDEDLETMFQSLDQTLEQLDTL
jgi:hypothetical protein